MAILPNGCLLSSHERNVVYITMTEGETPCAGCPKRDGCEARVDKDLRTAMVLMGEPVEPPRICKRCGAAIELWRVERNTRVWTCKKTDNDRWVCGWEMSELAVGLLTRA